MIVRIDANTKLENPRNYPAGVVEILRDLLTAGAAARADLRRAHCFEVDSRQETFFIHVSPVTGNVLLVAKWLRAPANAYLSASARQHCVDLSECF